MAKVRRKVARDALQYIDPHWTNFRANDVKQGFLDERDCPSPIRVGVQTKTDLSALDDLVRRLVADGFDSDVSQSVALELLLRPTLALARTTARGEDILQAIVISRDPERTGSPIEDADLRLWVRATIAGDRPPTIDVTGFDFEMFDTQDEVDGNKLAVEASAWLAEFPVPGPAGKSSGGQLILLGNPANANLTDAPADWSAKLIQIASAFDMSFRCVVSHSDASSFPAKSLIVSTDADVSRAATRNGTPSGKIVRLTSMGKSFDQLISEIVNLLITNRLEPEDAPPEHSRALDDDEMVFHRKIGKSLKFDRFDAGATTPCRHGSQGFVRFHGPKSTKGMARRYTNFTPDMLFHCEKYPNCGVYAVFHHR